jgi:hypothetical protein
MPKTHRDCGPLSLEEARRTVQIAETSASRQAAADRLGLSIRGLQKRLTTAETIFGLVVPPAKPGPKRANAPEFVLPAFPDADIPVEQKIEYATARFAKKQASFDAHTWFPVKIKGNLPIGLLCVGDPHLDDDGCNWPVLRRHVEIAKNTPGIVAVNIGDTTNNWVGRLMRLFANQEASGKTAQEFAEWFMLDSGVNWLLVILGNHDAWNDGAALLAQMAKRYGAHKLICHDWEARFSLVFPNGWAPRVYASHDFKGSSIWNIMHGLIREGQIGEEADLYVAGHRHNAGEMGFENVGRGRYQHFIRVRGYKFFDDHARRLGFKEQSMGCSALVIFDPIKRAISRHVDVEEGAEYLTYLRGRAK